MLIVFSVGGTTAVPVEMARGARARGLRVVAVTSVAQLSADSPDATAGSRLIDEADLVIDLCTPPADALCSIDGIDTPVGPGSSIAAIAIVNSIKVRTARLLAERGALPPVITRASVIGAERSRALIRCGVWGTRTAHRPGHRRRGRWTSDRRAGGGSGLTRSHCPRVRGRTRERRDAVSCRFAMEENA